VNRELGPRNGQPAPVTCFPRVASWRVSRWLRDARDRGCLSRMMRAMDVLPRLLRAASRTFRIAWPGAPDVMGSREYRPVRALLLGLDVLGALAIVAPALAADKAPQWENVALTVEQNPSCASETELFRHLERQVPGIRRASAGESARRAKVQVATGADGRVTGRLWMQDLRGRAVMRELPASTCDELLDALALVIAVTLLPDAARSPDLPPPSPPLQSPSVNHQGQSSPDLPTAPIHQDPSTPTHQGPSEAAAPAEAGAAAAPLPESRAEVGMRWGPLFAVRASAVTGMAPSVMAGVLGLVGMVPHTARAWVPSFELGVERLLPTRDTLFVEGSPVEIDTRAWLLRGGTCAGRWRRGPLVVTPCIDFTAGKIEAKAAGAGVAQSTGVASGWWIAAGAHARGSLSLGRGFRAEWSAGLRLPFRRYAFDFSAPPSEETGTPSPARTISPFRTGEVAAAGELGVAWTHE
jgi:hypothetical protein